MVRTTHSNILVMINDMASNSVSVPIHTVAIWLVFNTCTCMSAFTATVVFSDLVVPALGRQ